MVDTILPELEWPRTTPPLEALYRLINTKYPEYGATPENSVIRNLQLFPTKRYPGRTTFQLVIGAKTYNHSYRRLDITTELERFDIRIPNSVAITDGLLLREINEKYNLVLSLDDVIIPDEFVVTGETTIKYRLKAQRGSYVWINGIDLYIEIYAEIPPEGPGEINARAMFVNLWEFLKRATGDVAVTNKMPPLITKEGLVKHHQNNGDTQFDYIPPGAATMESLALMMRAVSHAFQYDNDATKLAFVTTLMNAACKYHYFGNRPAAVARTPWHFTNLINAGPAFAVFGPLVTGGRLDSNGVIGYEIAFVRGRAVIDPKLAVLYKVVSQDAEFEWSNVQSDIVAGTGFNVAVDYYVDAKQRKHYGVQRNVGYAQPFEEGSTEPAGTIVLKAPNTATYKANYSTAVVGTNVAYGDAYDVWPMWRRLQAGERQQSTSVLHWLTDAFRTMIAVRPEEREWQLALDRTLDTWSLACNHDSDNSYLFKSGSSGKFDSFPLTHARAEGVNSITLQNWTVQAPHAYIQGERTAEGYVSMRLPFMAGTTDSTDSLLRTGAYFENDQVYMTYDSTTQLYMDVQSTVTTPCAVVVESTTGELFETTVLAGGIKNPQTITMNQLVRFQATPGDADGKQSGDWQDTPTAEWVPPVYNAVSFPGYRVGLVGDALLSVQSDYTAPSLANKWHEAHGRPTNSLFNAANQLLGQRLVLEPSLPDRFGRPLGINMAVAGSRVSQWTDPTIDPFGTGATSVGPMYAMARNVDAFDIAILQGGIQDLVRNTHTEDLLLNLKKAILDIARRGKWVFVVSLLPITREHIGGWYRPGGGGWLGAKPAVEDRGFTLGEQNVIRQRILAINQGLRDWFTKDKPKNCFWVDVYDVVVGPNGLDPAGTASNDKDPQAQAKSGNYKEGFATTRFTYNGMELTPTGAAVVGKALAIKLVESGVPVPSVSQYPIKYQDNLLSNPTFDITTDRPANLAGTSKLLGRAIGLGPALTDITHGAGNSVNNNVGLGYKYGQVPDHWFVYRASNMNGEAWANFNSYTWRDLSPTWPALAEYLDDATWVDSCLESKIIWIGDERCWQLTFATPKTGNRNESFLVKAMVPHEQPAANTTYVTGEYLQGEALVEVTNASSLYGWRFGLNLVSVNSAGVASEGVGPLGSKMAGFDNTQVQWPPTELPKQLAPTNLPALLYRTPVIKAPERAVDADRYYAELTFEFALDASAGAASVTVVIRQPKVRKTN